MHFGGKVVLEGRRIRHLDKVSLAARTEAVALQIMKCLNLGQKGGII